MEQNNPRRDIIVGTVIAIIAVVGLIVYMLQANQQQSSVSRQSPSKSHSEAAPAPGNRVAITFTDNGFEPQDLTVSKGSVVTVTNRSSHQMQFSSNDHPAHTDNSEMNLSSLAPGESDAYTATKTGTFGFHDHIDDSKTGTITVTE